jgi:hypothetical protein
MIGVMVSLDCQLEWCERIWVVRTDPERQLHHPRGRGPRCNKRGKRRTLPSAGIFSFCSLATMK